MLRSRLSYAGLQNVVQTLRSASSWATVQDPTALSGSNAAQAYNLGIPNVVNGQWTLPKSSKSIPCPMSGEEFIRVPDTQPEEAQPFIDSLKAVPKSGLHNPYKNPDRYVMYGDITFKVAEEMRKPEVLDFFARLIQRTSPKSYGQARGEVVVTTRFLENFCGDQVRFMARGFKVSGDHAGQSSAGLRWPYGPVGLITPFNFPLEIPVLQLMGALYMGNKPLLHVDHRVSLVIEQFVRLLHDCGMPMTDVDLLHGPGTTMGHILDHAKPRSTLFTGSQRVAEKLAADTAGKVFLEDAGFDWKILGPDVQDVDYVAWQCDQDAYACSGQKCSAQSIMFMHEAWAGSGLLERFGERAQRRSMDNLTVGPVITVTTARMLEHVDTLLKIPGAQLLWGGKELNGGDHTIPACYGAIEPTAVKVPLREMLRPGAFEAATTEVFGPLTVITEYGADEEHLVLEACERMDAHLTAAIVSNDVRFVQRMLAGTVNGTTYVGMRGRTTGAPQNHWFGPAGDPRGAGIGTPEAIRLVWSCHREVIEDFGPVPATHPMEQS